jgi:hypothetical protein
LNLPNTDATVAKSSQTTADVLKALENCPTQSYVVIKQIGVSSADYADGRSAPSFSQYMGGMRPAITTTYAVPDVVGEIDADVIVSHLKSKCGHGAGMTTFSPPRVEQPERMHSLHKAGM